jgi:hypothetical protein
MYHGWSSSDVGSEIAGANAGVEGSSKQLV